MFEIFDKQCYVVLLYLKNCFGSFIFIYLFFFFGLCLICFFLIKLTRRILDMMINTYDFEFWIYIYRYQATKKRKKNKRERPLLLDSKKALKNKSELRSLHETKVFLENGKPSQDLSVVQFG